MAKSIQKEVKSKILEIVEAFNKEHRTTYVMTFRGQFAYLAKTQAKPMANVFRKMIAQKMGLPIEKIPKTKNGCN